MFKTGFPRGWSTMKKLIWLKRAVLSAASAILKTVSGLAPLLLGNALARPIHSLTQYGKCTQSGTPTPDAPVPILCNNGEIKARHHSGLPLGYTLLEYIQSTGSQYINTNITGSTNAVIDMQGTPRTDEMVVFMLAPLNASSYQNGFGQYRSTMGGNFDVGTRRIYNVSYTSSSLTVNGVGPLDRYIANNVNLALFGSTFSNRRISNAKLYSAKIYNNDTLVRDFIPAKNSSNVVGLYDLVSGQFFTNRGTDDFTAGAIVDDPVEIYTDGTPEVLTVRGKNLFDVSTETQGYYIAADGKITGNAASAYSALIPCKPNTEYIFSGIARTAYGNKRIHAYDANGNWISQISYASSIPLNEAFSTTGTTPATASYLRISYSFADTDKQLEQGSSATDYEPYVTPQTVTDIPMLLGVGDYKDEAELISGLLTHKIGIYVFDGTEGWNVRKVEGGKTTLQLVSVSKIPYIIADDVVCLSTHLAYLGVVNGIDSVYTKGMGLVFFKSSQYPKARNVYVNVPSTVATTEAETQSWLATQYAAGTPVIVLYPLATETTEQTTAQHLVTHEGTNIVDAASNVDPVELKAEYYATE